MLYPAELRGRPRRREDSLPPGKCEEVATGRYWRRIAAALFLLAAASPAVADTGTCPAGGAEAATIAAVADPATLRLADGSFVRLAGIDVPAWAAPAATAELERLAPPKTVVKLVQIGSGAGADRYGRGHGYVFLTDGRQLQAVLVGAGAARARWLPNEAACFVGLRSLEAHARAAGLGIWASPQAVLAASDGSLVHRAGLYELVSGRLVSVGHGTATTFLNFGRDHRRDFTVMLSAGIAKTLTQTLGSVDALVGRQLLVRGVIENSRGPAIHLNDAAEIELSDDSPRP